MKKIFLKTEIIASVLFGIIIIIYACTYFGFNEDLVLNNGEIIISKSDWIFFTGIFLLSAYYFIILGFYQRIYFLFNLSTLAKNMKFKSELNMITTPKLSGTYKGNKFKIEYWHKPYGKHPVIARTYVKIYLKEKKVKISQAFLNKFRNVEGLIIVKHSEEKSYILLKLSGTVTNESKLKTWMDYANRIKNKCKKA